MMKRTCSNKKSDSLILLEYLELQGNRYVSKEEICRDLPDTFPSTNSPKVHDVCPYIWVIKNFINSNLELFGNKGKLIISNSKGDIKIPTREEAIEYLNNEKKLACIRFKRVWDKQKALALNNQTTIEGFIYEILNE